VIQREVVDRVRSRSSRETLSDGDTVTIDIIDDELAIRSIGHAAS